MISNKIFIAVLYKTNQSMYRRYSPELTLTSSRCHHPNLTHAVILITFRCLQVTCMLEVIMLVILVSSIRWTCPYHLSLCDLIHFTMSSPCSLYRTRLRKHVCRLLVGFSHRIEKFARVPMDNYY